MPALSLASQLQFSYVCTLISFAILYYDYALVLSDEIEYLWPPKNRITKPSSLYLLTRFISIFGHIPSFIFSFATGSIKNKCAIFHLFHNVVMGIVQLLTGILCLLRVSALYSRNRMAISLLAALVVICSVLGVWGTIIDTGPTLFLDLDVPGCNPQYLGSTSLRYTLSWAGVFVFDIAIFLLTLNKALKIGLQHRHTLWRVLLRDGAIYFCGLAFANLFNILTFTLAPPLLRGIGTFPVNVLSATLVCRVMISLRMENKRLAHERARAAADGQPGMTAFADEYDMDETETVGGTLVFRRSPDDEGEVELRNLSFDKNAVLGSSPSASDLTTDDGGIPVKWHRASGSLSQRGVPLGHMAASSSSGTSPQPPLRNKRSEVSTTVGTGESSDRLMLDLDYAEGEGRSGSLGLDEFCVLEVRRTRGASDEV